MENQVEELQKRVQELTVREDRFKKWIEVLMDELISLLRENKLCRQEIIYLAAEAEKH